MAGQGNKNLKRNIRPAAPSLLQRVDVYSAEKGSKDSVSLINGTVRLLYWESILADTVSASVVFTDAGNTMKSTKSTRRGTRPTKKKVSAVEGLPILGGEKVYLKFTDNKGNTLDFNDKNGGLLINRIPTLATDSQTSSKSYELGLGSPEFVKNNEKVRVRYPSAETLSEQVKNIFKKVLKTKKKLDIEDTKNSMNYIGKNRKPFYVINDLSKKSVSAGSQELGFSAGYLFWETSEGYHFKSIDTILTGEQKKKIIYNESADNKIPKGYDIKALTLETNNLINVQKKYQIGAYCIRSIEINPEDTNYKVDLINAFDPKVQEKLNLSGGYFAPESDEFTEEGADAQYSRTTYYFADVGQQHISADKKNTEEQIEKSKEENFKKSEVVNQSIMRYNQLFASQITITIPGDFSLHAGDCVWMDIPEVSESENKACGDDVNKVDGGLYTIADLCHYITAKQTYTKLNLIRDSFGRVKKSQNDQASKVMDANFLPNIK